MIFALITNITFTVDWPLDINDQLVNRLTVTGFWTLVCYFVIYVACIGLVLVI